MTPFFSQHHSANRLSHPTGGGLCWGQSWGPASRCCRSTNIHRARSAGGNLRVRSGLPQPESGAGLQGWRQPPVHREVPQATAQPSEGTGVHSSFSSSSHRGLHHRGPTIRVEGSHPEGVAHPITGCLFCPKQCYLFIS